MLFNVLCVILSDYPLLKYVGLCILYDYKNLKKEKKSVTNFRKPSEVGLKLAITLRHLATGETYTSLQYHWLVGQTTICKFEPSLLNSRKSI